MTRYCAGIAAGMVLGVAVLAPLLIDLRRLTSDYQTAQPPMDGVQPCPHMVAT